MTPPYRLWSDECPEPPPPRRTIVAKLKPAREVSRLARLVDNARLRAVRPVFGEGDPAAGRRPVDRARLSHARGLVTIEVAPDENPRTMARHLESLGAEIDYAFIPPPRTFLARRRRRLAPETPDPLLSRQWGHNAVRIAQARARPGFTDAHDIVVAVADSGIDLAHPDLEGAIGEYRNFVRGEGSRDYAGHGTHVAGIVAAEMNNGIGIAGVCSAKILGLKVLPSRAAWDAAGYYRALAYCIGRAQVLNLSLGSTVFDPGERDVIADVVDAGIVVVAAMGNEYAAGNPTEYPAALDGVCAVGATDQADRRAAFSNTGRHLALCAPGVSILSTTPTYRYPHGASDYDDFDGTSMAAPHVAAAAALVLAAQPGLTPAAVIRRLTRSATRVAGMKSRPSRSYGWGRLDIEKALDGKTAR